MRRTQIEKKRITMYPSNMANTIEEITTLLHGKETEWRDNLKIVAKFLVNSKAENTKPNKSYNQ